MASFKKLKSGWQYRVSYKDGDKYRTKSKNGFSTKKEAQLAAAKVERMVNNNVKVGNDIIFVEYLESWYELYKKGKYSVSYDYDAELAIENARTFFRNTKLKDINRKLYQKFINWLGDGRTTGTIKKRHMITNECLKFAIEERLIFKDPTYKVNIKGTKPAKKDSKKYINYTDATKLIDELKTDIRPRWDSRHMCLLALATGLRFGEVLGLKWTDLNFEDKMLSVDRSFDYTHSKKMKSAKTASSSRKIKLDDHTIQMLQTYREKNEKRHPTYMFLDKNMNHVSNRAVNKALKKACQRARIQEITFHSLRHTHCSILLFQGVNIHYISKRLGHSKASITMDVYSHMLQEMDQRENDKARNIMSELYNPKNG